eukprot:CAMPEP_0185846408 /NCGR_PEP_ID=MMETSP1354-20130828/2057_1 /TAXON_ID=708628 /ORGANISM="Erythrolobus madagascarensis, Strain CCMP3276" /LENGTH=472 /DNA_ID=CAMNT_0028546537 /DNA_START=108 /DNA_END=1526 /DNA_ORIENTATION=-
MSVFACLSDDVVRIICDNLQAARDKYSFAKCDKRLYQLLWKNSEWDSDPPRSLTQIETFDAVTTTADFDTAVTVTLPELPAMQHVSKNGHLVAAIAQSYPSGAILVLWHTPSRTIMRFALPGNAPVGEYELRMADEGSLAAVLHARAGSVHLYRMDETGGVSYPLRVTERRRQNEDLKNASRLAVSSCGRFAALFYNSSHLVRVLSTQNLSELSSWTLTEHAHVDHELSEVCFGGSASDQSELCFAFREIDGLRHCVAAYEWMSGKELRSTEISTPQHVRAVAASGALLAFADIEKARGSHSRRALRSRCSIAVFEIGKGGSQDNSTQACDSRVVLSGFESVKLRKYEAVQSRCAVYERELPRGSCYGRRHAPVSTQRALLNMTTERNRWVVRATPVPCALGGAVSEDVAQARCVPLARSENALLEESALVNFSADAHWALFVRFDDVRPCMKAPPLGAPREVLFSVQNVRV